MLLLSSGVIRGSRAAGHDSVEGRSAGEMSSYAWTWATIFTEDGLMGEMGGACLSRPRPMSTERCAPPLGSISGLSTLPETIPEGLSIAFMLFTWRLLPCAVITRRAP